MAKPLATGLIIRFAEDVDPSAREDLATRLRDAGLPASLGLDLGDRGLDRGLRAVISMARASGEATRNIAAHGLEWLLASARTSEPLVRVEIEARDTHVTVRISPRETQVAIELLPGALATAHSDGPLAWDGEAWSSQTPSAGPSPPSAAPATASSVHRGRAVRVLVVATEWFSVHGGVSTFNRLLCKALAHAGAEVFCHVPHATPQEREHARAMNVMLTEARAIPGSGEYEDLSRPVELPGGQPPDLIIGHGWLTGPAAKRLAEDTFPGSAWFYFIHTSPDQTLWYRPDQVHEAAKLAEKSYDDEWALASTATRVVAVGPLLHERARGDLNAYPDLPDPIRFDPGFDALDPAKRKLPTGYPARILILGRLDDPYAKGVDIAARAVGRALELGNLSPSDIALVCRGVPPEQAADLRAKIQTWAGAPSLEVIPRSFTTKTERLKEDLLRATLALMPSPTEPFGLAGLEAITAGTPLLTSERSGLGLLLTQTLEDPRDTKRSVLPVTEERQRDADTWGSAIAGVLRGPQGAFADADKLRRELAEKRTWAMAATRLLDELGRSRQTPKHRAPAPAREPPTPPHIQQTNHNNEHAATPSEHAPQPGEDSRASEAHAERKRPTARVTSHLKRLRQRKRAILSILSISIAALTLALASSLRGKAQSTPSVCKTEPSVTIVADMGLDLDDCVTTGKLIAYGNERVDLRMRRASVRDPAALTTPEGKGLTRIDSSVASYQSCTSKLVSWVWGILERSLAQGNAICAHTRQGRIALVKILSNPGEPVRVSITVWQPSRQ